MTTPPSVRNFVKVSSPPVVMNGRPRGRSALLRGHGPTSPCGPSRFREGGESSGTAGRLAAWWRPYLGPGLGALGVVRGLLRLLGSGLLPGRLLGALGCALGFAHVRDLELGQGIPDRLRRLLRH